MESRCLTRRCSTVQSIRQRGMSNPKNGYRTQMIQLIDARNAAHLGGTCSGTDNMLNNQHLLCAYLRLSVSNFSRFILGQL